MEQIPDRVISGERKTSSAAIIERANRAASGFTALGVKAGDVVSLILRNDFPFFEASLAAQRIGAYCMPVNWHGKAQEVAYVLRDSGAKVVVAHADLLLQVLPAIPEGVGLLVAPTPPEVAKAYGVTASVCEPPSDAIHGDAFVSRNDQCPWGPLAL